MPVASRLELLAKALDRLKLSWSLALWSFNSLELPNICLHVWQVYKSPVTPAENKEIFKTFCFASTLGLLVLVSVSVRSAVRHLEYM